MRSRNTLIPKKGTEIKEYLLMVVDELIINALYDAPRVGLIKDYDVKFPEGRQNQIIVAENEDSVGIFASRPVRTLEIDKLLIN
ncbi:MAG: hypothetical protein R2827_00450 [Bdellovibrionales bacterium]